MMNYVSIFTLFLGPIKDNFIGYWPVGKNSSLILQNREKKSLLFKVYCKI